MIPRLTQYSDYRRTPPLFASSRQLRPLRVLVDAALVDDLDFTYWTPNTILAGLLTHEAVELYRYADAGPPPSVTSRDHPVDGVVPLGWVVATPRQPSESDFASHSLVWSDGERVFRSWIAGNLVEVAGNETDVDAYEGLPADVSRDRRIADATAGGAARQLRADLLITERAYALAVSPGRFGGATVCGPADALALVGLYLRARGEHIIAKPPGEPALTYDRGLFFWVAAHELLPDGWRWQRALALHGAQQGSDELAFLGKAVMYRTTRVLQARDELQRLINRPQDNNVADDSLAALDTCLIYLMGALDAVARGVDSVLGLGSGHVGVGWQHDRWLGKVRKADRGLADVAAKGTSAHDLLTILLRLRNSIHGAGLSAVAVQRGARPPQTVVGLPVNDAATIVESIAKLGGADAWGVTVGGAGRLFIDPGAFLEQLLPRVLQLLNGLMAKSPVASLAAAVSETAGDSDDAFSERSRLSIRWQLGL